MNGSEYDSIDFKLLLINNNIIAVQIVYVHSKESKASDPHSSACFCATSIPTWRTFLSVHTFFSSFFFFFFGLFLQLPFVVWLVWNISCEQIHDLLSCLCVPLLWEYTSTTNLKEGIPVCVWVFYSGMKKEFWCKIMIIWKVLSWMLVHSGTHFSKSMIRGENKHMQRDMLYN